jgi:hypothetical protein
VRGTIPPGVLVPLHSHTDPETFLPISGELEGLVVSPEGFAWVAIGPPTDEAIARFLVTAERYGYWNATPEENAAVGLHLG